MQVVQLPFHARTLVPQFSRMILEDPGRKINYQPPVVGLGFSYEVLAPWVGVIFLPSLLYRTRGGGARLRRPSRDRTLLVFLSVYMFLGRRGDGDGVRLPPRFFSAARVWQVHNLPREQPWYHARHSCPPSRTNVPNDLAVNGTRDAVLQLEVHLGDGVLGKDRGVRDVTCRRGMLASWATGLGRPRTATRGNRHEVAAVAAAAWLS